MNLSLNNCEVFVFLVNMYRKHLKPTIDFIISGHLLVLLLPILMVLYLVGLFLFARKPIFLQTRTGLLGKHFTIIKFRTLQHDRVTSYGNFLRKYSLDELPQLFNVVKGEMSLVGPRPLLPEYLEHYTPFEKQRLRVKPGITGWAQVNGRNSLDWAQKFKYDIYYVDNLSFVFDLKILWFTFRQLLHGKHTKPVQKAF